MCEGEYRGYKGQYRICTSSKKENLPSPRRGRGDEQEGKRRRRRRGERRRGEAGRKRRGRVRGTQGVEEKKRRRR